MNNIQKAFKNKAKRGLCMAAGGMIDPNQVDMNALKTGTVDPNGSDFDTINAEKTLRWAQEDAAKKASYGQKFEPTMGATDLVKGLLGRQQSAQPQQQAAQAPLAPAAPVETTFEQDNDARIKRIQGYGASMRGTPTLGMADGGTVESPEQLMARMAAKYGTAPTPQASAPAPQPMQQAPTPQPKPQGFMDRLRGAATGGLEGRMRAAGLAQGGTVRKTEFQGKGDGTSDDIPVTIAGQDVNVSDGEKAVVLPFKTAQNPEAVSAIEDIIERTNGKPTLRDGAQVTHAEFGATIGTGQRPTIYGDYAIPVNHPQQQMPQLPELPAMSIGTGQRPTIHGNGGLPAPVVQQGIDTMRGQMAPPPKPDRWSLGSGQRPTIHGNGGLPAPVVQQGIDTMRGQVATPQPSPSRLSSGAIREMGADIGQPKEDPEALMQRIAQTRGLAYQQPAAPVVPQAAGEATDPDTDGRRTYSEGYGKNFAYRDGLRGVAGPSNGPDSHGLDPVVGAKPAPKAVAPTATQTSPEQAAKAAAAKEAAVTAGNFQGQNHRAEAVSMGELSAADTIANVVDKATGVSRSGNTGLRGMAQRFDTYKTNETALEARNAQEQLRGSGARFKKLADGSLEINNSGDFDGSTKMAYTGKDGKPTAIHEGSLEHARGLKDAQGIRNQLANIQQMNLETNAGENITDVGLRNSARATLAAQATARAAATAKAPNWLDIEKHKLDLDKAQTHKDDVKQLQQNTVNAAEASRSKEARGDIRTILNDMYEGDVEGKKVAQRYAANYRPINQAKETPEQYQQGILEDLDMEMKLDAAGQHWLSSEKAGSGHASMWKQRPAGLSDAARGYFGGDVFEDIATGQVMKLPHGLSEQQRAKFLKERIIK